MDPVVLDAIRDIDIADTYPKYMNISLAEAHDYAVKYINKWLRGVPMGVILVRLPYDQGVRNCLDAIKRNNLGLGKHLTKVIVPNTLDGLVVKFDRPFCLLEVE